MLDRGKHGNEVFRYHGTSRKCSLGSNGQSKLCNSSSCSACSILRTSFNVSLANPAGAYVPRPTLYNDTQLISCLVLAKASIPPQLRTSVCHSVKVWFHDMADFVKRSAGYSGMPGNLNPERIMFLNKVILGKPYNASGFAEVMSCPTGYDSVSSFVHKGVLPECRFVGCL